MTRAAIIEPSSGIAGDMFLGALLDLGLDEAWLQALPGELALDGVSVRTSRVVRADIACRKVDFAIPPQPHGRHLKHIRAIVDACGAPASVKERANHAFELLTTAEAAVHGTTVEKVHLHEVGAVDAILDVVGSIWGLEIIGAESLFCGTVALGDGFVDAAHGRMAVPAPAVARLLEGFDVRPGPPASGELTTPTGAALIRTLAVRGVPDSYRPVRSGYGAGTKDFKGRANALRIMLADIAVGNETSQSVVLLACDVDDMTGEYLAAAATSLRDAGALDVTLMQVAMKKGRPGTRIEVLCAPEGVERVEAALFLNTTTIGVRRTRAERTALVRISRTVTVFGHAIDLKVVSLPDGSTRAKPEFEDVAKVAAATGKSPDVIRIEATKAAGAE
ncbi:MAG: nickel pincer cofactor biosynthesis protein LarC [Gemmatimonadetes bacterium]|nr:nickel pincer cofactor biosynthesis protein LarC [Gemmatimonadota bacterium]